MKQLDIFNDICARRHKGNPFSMQANRETNKSRDRQRILAHMATVTDATGDEIEAALSMVRSTVSARWSELKATGALIKTTRRKTRTGSTAQAWKLSHFAGSDRSFTGDNPSQDPA